MRHVRRRSSENKQVYLSLQEYRRQVFIAYMTFKCDFDTSVVCLDVEGGTVDGL